MHGVFPGELPGDSTSACDRGVDDLISQRGLQTKRQSDTSVSMSWSLAYAPSLHFLFADCFHTVCPHSLDFELQSPSVLHRVIASSVVGFCEWKKVALDALNLLSLVGSFRS